MSGMRGATVSERDEFKVVMAAVAWWRSKRPLADSESEHLSNPRVNLTTDWEIDLAIAVSSLLKSRGAV